MSVIVPTRNRAAWLEDCLSTLAAQVCREAFEVLVVDNASTDRTALVIADQCRRDARFRGITADRLGRSVAMNAALPFAKGSLLLFTDDDVLVDAGRIQSYLEFFAKSHPDDLLIAGGLILPIPNDLAAWPRWLGTPGLSDLPTLHWGSERALLAFESVWGANMAVPARVFERLGVWNETLGRRGDERGTFEDTELQDRFRSRGGTVWFCPQCIVHHRVDRRSITPRRVLHAAFTRGSNDYWREVQRAQARGAGNPHLSHATGPWALARQLWQWLVWTAVFRARPDKLVFERSRQAAWGSGWAMERFTAAHRPEWLTERLAARGGLDRLTRAVRRIAFLCRRLALRSAPDAPR